MRVRPLVAVVLFSGLTSVLLAQGRTTVPSRPPELTLGPPTPRGPLDGKVQSLNRPVFETVRAIRAPAGPAITAAGADQLVQAIRTDGMVDDAEWDLLDELCNARTRVVTITGSETEAAAGEPVTLTSVAGAARDRLAAAFPALDFEKAWADGADGWAALTAEHGRGGVTAVRTVHFVADKLAVEWSKSTTANAYQPLRAVLVERYKMCDSVGDAKSASRTLLRDAAALLDTYQAGKLPDFIYTWIK